VRDFDRQRQLKRREFLRFGTAGISAFLGAALIGCDAHSHGKNGGPPHAARRQSLADATPTPLTGLANLGPLQAPDVNGIMLRRASRRASSRGPARSPSSARRTSGMVRRTAARSTRRPAAAGFTSRMPSCHRHGRRGRDQVRRRGQHHRRLPDPRRHEQELRGRPRALGPVVLLRGERRPRHRVRVRPDGRVGRGGASRARALQPRGHRLRRPDGHHLPDGRSDRTGASTATSPIPTW